VTVFLSSRDFLVSESHPDFLSKVITGNSQFIQPLRAYRRAESRRSCKVRGKRREQQQEQEQEEEGKQEEEEEEEEEEQEQPEEQEYEEKEQQQEQEQDKIRYRSSEGQF